MATAKELRVKTADELKTEIADLARAHFNLRLQKATQQLKKTSELPRLRREIARAKTVLREKAQ